MAFWICLVTLQNKQKSHTKTEWNQPKQTKQTSSVNITVSVLPLKEVSKTNTHLLFPFPSNLLLFSFFFNQFECKLFIDFWKFLKRGKQLISKLFLYTCKNLYALHL